MKPLAALSYRTKRASISARKKMYIYLLSRRKFNLSDTIFMTGSGRSGTTWLAELLMLTPGYCLISEPDDLREDPSLLKAGFNWHTYLEPDSVWQSGHQIFEKTLTGKRLFGYLLDNSLRQILTSKRLVIKSTRSNSLLPWISHHFNLRGIIHIIRHPCAVVHSGMKHPGFERSGKEIDDTIIKYLEIYRPDLLPKLEKWTSDEEIRAVKWCFHQYIPLKHEPKTWYTAIYEKLVESGTEEIQNLYAYLNISSAPIISKMNTPSRSVYSWSANPTDPLEARLGGWKKNLFKEQITKILNVVEAFGIEGYSDNILPDYNKIGVTS